MAALISVAVGTVAVGILGNMSSSVLSMGTGVVRLLPPLLLNTLT